MLEVEIGEFEHPSETATPPCVPSSSSKPATGALAMRFVEMLLEYAGKLPVLPKAAEKPSTLFPFLDDLEGGDEVPSEEDEHLFTLDVDEAAAAVLLAARFEEEPAMLKALRREAPVYAVHLPDSRSAAAYKTVLSVCAIGRTATLLSTGDLDHVGRLNSQRSERRQAVLLSCDVEKRDRPLLLERTMAALSLGVPVCALSVDVGRAVPDLLRSVCDGTIAVGGWNAPMLAVLIEAVTGSPADVPDENWIADVVLDDIRMSVSRHRGAQNSLERLRAAVGKRLARADDLPPLESLHGYGEAMDLARDMLVDLDAYRSGEIAWSQVPRGLVLAGPTGTGKTFFARCFAKAAGLPLVIGSMATWQSSGEGHLGHCLAAMKATFAEARSKVPCVLFIDEIDSIGDRATFHHRHRDYSTQVVNCLLEELDGASDRSGIVVLAATNLVDRIDPAVLRPGRLDRTVHIELPDVPALVGIIRTQLGRDLPDADLLPVALAGRGSSGADVSGWVRRAKGIARRAVRALTVRDLLDAVREGRSVIPERDKRRIALHESAHACAAIALDLGVVSGVSLHDAGGVTHMRPTLRTTTRAEALAAIVHLLAGRAAERVFTGSVSAGAGGRPTSDLALATRTAFAVEASWGLGESGPLWMGDFIDDDLSRLTMMPGVVAAARRLLGHCEVEAERLVAANSASILRCTDRLLDVGHLDERTILSALGDVAPFSVKPDPHGPVSAQPTAGD